MTNLPASPFMNSAAPPAVECEAVANAPAPLAATANLSDDVGRNSHPESEPYASSATEAAGSIRTAASDITKAEYKAAAIAAWERTKPAMAQAIRDMPGDMYFPPKEWLPELFPECQTDDISEVFRVANYLCAQARQFVPDYPSLYQAMLDPNAPRALETDPVWADEAPLFLKSIG